MGVHISANSAKMVTWTFRQRLSKSIGTTSNGLLKVKKEIAIYGDCFIFRETLREFHVSNIYIFWNNFQFPIMSLLSGRLRDG